MNQLLAVVTHSRPFWKYINLLPWMTIYHDVMSDRKKPSSGTAGNRWRPPATKNTAGLKSPPTAAVATVPPSVSTPPIPAVQVSPQRVAERSLPINNDTGEQISIPPTPQRIDHHDEGGSRKPPLRLIISQRRQITLRLLEQN
jgi:hypothetical protein